MPSAHRVALVLVDGIGDVALPSLGFRTPLEAARLPNLDALAAAGVNGLMDPVDTGLACGSDTAHLSLLGYNPRIHYRGRGAFESMGAGLPMAPGDIAFKSNFATLDEESGIVTSRRADRHFEALGPVLCAALDGCRLPAFPEYQVNVRYATEHRCGVVVRGPGLSGNISGTDPLKDNLPLRTVEGLDGTPEAEHTARVVNAVSAAFRSILRQHPINAQRVAEGKNPANVVLLRGCGIRIQVPSLAAQAGVVPCMVAPTKIIAGLGLSLGMDILEAPGATGDYRTQLTAKAAAIAAALAAPAAPLPRVQVPGVEGSQPSGQAAGYDFGFLHIKAVDDAGHDRAGGLKVALLEAVDRMVGQLAAQLWAAQAAGGPRYTLVVTGDHSTPVDYGDHSHEPVPLTACALADFVARRGEARVVSVDMAPFPLPHAASVEQSEPAPGRVEQDVDTEEGPPSGDVVRTFSEVAAARGSLGRFPGSSLMTLVKQCIGETTK